MSMGLTLAQAAYNAGDTCHFTLPMALNSVEVRQTVQ